jgi:hypothetical protein
MYYRDFHVSPLKKCEENMRTVKSKSAIEVSSWENFNISKKVINKTKEKT